MKLMTVKEVASITRRSVQTVRQDLHMGRIPYIKIGKSTLIDESALMEALVAMTVGKTAQDGK